MLHEFGQFRIDSADRRLWRDGQPVHLTPKAFELLLAFVESDGKLLSKQDLMDRVWPGMFVEESNLAQNIATIRKALDDQSKDHQYIQTVPKLGYRFVTPVINAAPVGLVAPKSGLGQFNGWSGLLTTVATLAIVMSAYAGWRMLERRGPSSKPQPITSLRGMECHASFSPDGSQLVFAWMDPNGQTSRLYVAEVKGGQPPTQLAALESPDAYPAWSPDGRWIAFLQGQQGDSEIQLISPSGGNRRTISKTSGSVLAWWPDSNSVVVSDPETKDQPNSLFRVALLTGERTRVGPPSAGLGEVALAISRDGQKMAVVRIASPTEYEILVGRLETGVLRSLFKQPTPFVGLAWSPNGDDLIFGADRDSIGRLWRISSDPAMKPQPVKVIELDEPALFPAIGVRGESGVGRLVYTQLRGDINIQNWSIQRESSGLVNLVSTEIAPSTRIDSDPAFSPDGTKIVFASDRGGSQEIWVCRRDGMEAKQITRFGSGLAGSPKWSGDGRTIAFDYSDGATSALFVVGQEGSQLKKLDTRDFSSERPSWSADSSSIYFQCASPAGRQICRIPSAGGKPTILTKGGGTDAHESNDGRFVYFAKSVDQPGLWKVPVGGGAETLIHTEIWQGYWGILKDSIYYIRMDHGMGPNTLRVLHLSSGITRDVAQIPHGIVRRRPGLSIHPDGKSILLMQFDHLASDLMLVDRFH